MTNYQESSLILKKLGNSNILSLFWFLSDGNKYTINELNEKTNIKLIKIKLYLKELTLINLVEKEKINKDIYYCTNHVGVINVINCLKSIAING